MIVEESGRAPHGMTVNKSGVGNGNRTRNRRSHSPVLCQLSYSHRRLHYSNFDDSNCALPMSETRICLEPRNSTHVESSVVSGTARYQLITGGPLDLTRIRIGSL